LSHKKAPHCISAEKASSLTLFSVRRPKEIPVFNVTQHESKRITYGDFFKVANSMKFEIPFSMSLWYPNCQFTQNKFYYWLNVMLFQWLPAYFVDFLFLVFGQKRL
jgi:alcohol-forming fatty acyl-CoA reductase